MNRLSSCVRCAADELMPFRFGCDSCDWVGKESECVEEYIPGSSARSYYGPEPAEVVLHCPECNSWGVGSIPAAYKLVSRRSQPITKGALL